MGLGNNFIWQKYGSKLGKCTTYFIFIVLLDIEEFSPQYMKFGK